MGESYKDQGKTFVWLIAGGPMQKHLAKKLLDDGYKLIISDANANCECRDLASIFLCIDTFDIPAHIAAADSFLGEICIVSCLTVAADCHFTVAHICRHLGLSGPSLRLSSICNDKSEIRKTLLEAKIRQPEYGSCNTFEESRRLSLKIGFPCVLKSVDSSGSRGFSLLNGIDDLTRQRFDRAFKAGKAGFVILEKALIPLENRIAEQSVETLWIDGKMFWLNWVDRIFQRDLGLFDELSNFYGKQISPAVEIGHLNPAVHPLEIKEKTHCEVLMAGKALGADKEKFPCILKFDIMQTKEGPVVLEATPRLSGGWDSSGSSLLRGADFQVGFARLMIEGRCSWDLWHKFFTFGPIGYEHSAVLTSLVEGSEDCIGRKFALAGGTCRESALESALEKIIGESYVI